MVFSFFFTEKPENDVQDDNVTYHQRKFNFSGGLMAIITISRFEGSLGDEIAKDLANVLGYTLIDKTSIHEMAKHFKGNFDSEVQVIEEENKPGFFDFLFRERSVYGQMISAMIYDAAARDNVVILGRGGQFLLQGKCHVINARIVSHFETRVSRIMESSGAERVVAEGYLRNSDRKREDFINYLFRQDVAEPGWYDIVIDSDRFPRENIRDFFATELKRLDRQHPLTADDRILYKNQALEKYIEIVLLKHLTESNYIKVTVPSSGKVVLSGYLSTEAENSAALQLVNTVGGVETVVNNIIVSQYPVRPWY